MNIKKYLMNKGLSNAGSAGLMGNLYAESALVSNNLQSTANKRLNMTNEEYTDAVDKGVYKNFINDNAGYGLAQWTWWERKKKLLEYAKARGKSICNCEMQLDFLIEELKTSYKSLFELLKTTDSVREASDAVMTKFEKPKDQSDAAKQRRYEYSLKYYEKEEEKKMVKCGWASISETGKINGKKGDQTGREVKIGDYYEFGQKKCIRFKDTTLAKKAARACELLCKNEHIGYGQADRTSCYKECERIGWNIDRISEIKDCNVDCSELYAICVNFAFGKSLISSAVYSGNIANACKSTGYFDIITSFNKNTVRAGDGIVAESHHVIVVIESTNASASSNSNNAQVYALKDFIKDVQRACGAKVDGIAGSETLSKTVTLSKTKNSKHELVKYVQKRLNALGYNLSVDCDFGSKTEAAVKDYQKKNGCSVDGEITAKQKTWKKLLGMQ